MMGTIIVAIIISSSSIIIIIIISSSSSHCSSPPPSSLPPSLLTWVTTSIFLLSTIDLATQWRSCPSILPRSNPTLNFLMVRLLAEAKQAATPVYSDIAACWEGGEGGERGGKGGWECNGHSFLWVQHLPSFSSFSSFYCYTTNNNHHHHHHHPNYYYHHHHHHHTPLTFNRGKSMAALIAERELIAWLSTHASLLRRARSTRAF